MNLIPECHADKEDIILICDTLLELPKNIRDKTLKEVSFLVVSDVQYGFFTYFHLSKPYKDHTKQTNEKLRCTILTITQPLIVLDFSRMKKLSIHNKMSNVAHEIAHFILEHNDEVIRNDPEVERKADNLAEKWGFKRTYKESKYELFEKNHKNTTTKVI